VLFGAKYTINDPKHTTGDAPCRSAPRKERCDSKAFLALMQESVSYWARRDDWIG
jgi:hypothetical protein